MYGCAAAPAAYSYGRRGNAVLKLSITGAKAAVIVHMRRADGTAPRCAAGCGAWPCPAFSVAVGVLTGNAHHWHRPV